MTESEKFYFKILQWFLALGTTLLLFGMGYLISFGVAMFQNQIEHEKKQDSFENYVLKRLYIDSVHNNECSYDRALIKEILVYKLNVNNIDMPKMDAILPKNEEETSDTNVKLE